MTTTLQAGSIRALAPSAIKKLNTRQIQTIRSQIDAGAIVRRLQGFAIGAWERRRERSTDGVETYVEAPIEMTANQVRAAGIVLAKVMPDLQSVQMVVSDETQEMSTDELRRRFLSIVAEANAIDVQSRPVEQDLLALDGPGADDLLAL